MEDKEEKTLIIQPKQELEENYYRFFGEETNKDLSFIHSVFAQVALPYKSIPKNQRDYIKRNGVVSLAVSSGLLEDPITGELTLQSLPFGVKPRLLLIDIFSSAIKNRSKKVELEETISEMLKRLGVTPGYGKRGSVSEFHRQMKALIASKLTIGANFEDQAITAYPQPFKFVSLWYDKKDRQRSLFDNYVIISDDFYDSLINHSLPLDLRIIRQLKNSARCLDLYTYLTYRVCRINPYDPSGVFLSWEALQAQFSNTPGSLSSFKQKFTHDLKRVIKLYPVLIRSEYSGIRLFYSPPSVKKIEKSIR